jgi:hypothetical protein
VLRGGAPASPKSELGPARSHGHPGIDRRVDPRASRASAVEAAGVEGLVGSGAAGLPGGDRAEMGRAVTREGERDKWRNTVLNRNATRT